MDSIAGVLPVVATPFLPDWTIDHRALEREIDWLFDQGADGVTVGMVSEIQRLSTPERDALNRMVATLVNGRGHVVASVGAESTAVAVSLAASAAASGATAVMAAPPLLGATGLQELRRYVAAIVECSSLPVVLQDPSGYVGAAIRAHDQAALVQEFGAAHLYLKPEAEPLGPSITSIIEASGRIARIFDGSGGVALMDAYLRGIVGTMPGPDLTWAVRRLWDALKAADLDLALAITTHLSTLASMIPGLDGYVAFEKYLLVKQGVLTSARMRGPVAFTLDDVTTQLIDRLHLGLRSLVEASRAIDLHVESS